MERVADNLRRPVQELAAQLYYYAVMRIFNRSILATKLPHHFSVGRPLVLTLMEAAGAGVMLGFDAVMAINFYKRVKMAFWYLIAR